MMESTIMVGLNMTGTTVIHTKRNIHRLLVHLQDLFHINILQQHRNTTVFLPQQGHLGGKDIHLHLDLPQAQVTLPARAQEDLLGTTDIQDIGEMKMYVSANSCLILCSTRLIGAGVKVPQASHQNENGPGDKGFENGTSERSLFESSASSPVQNNSPSSSELSSPSPPPFPRSHKNKVSSRRKSVQFNLPSSYDGYESDDSDSASDSDVTIDYDRRLHPRDHRQSNSYSRSRHSHDREHDTDSNSVSSVSSATTSDSCSYSSSRYPERYHESTKHPAPAQVRRETDPDSDSTIELPPRFDEHGRLLDTSPSNRPAHFRERYIFMAQ